MDNAIIIALIYMGKLHQNTNLLPILLLDQLMEFYLENINDRILSISFLMLGILGILYNSCYSQMCVAFWFSGGKHYSTKSTVP